MSKGSSLRSLSGHPRTTLTKSSGSSSNSSASKCLLTARHRVPFSLKAAVNNSEKSAPFSAYLKEEKIKNRIYPSIFYLDQGIYILFVRLTNLLHDDSLSLISSSRTLCFASSSSGELWPPVRPAPSAKLFSSSKLVPPKVKRTRRNVYVIPI